MAKFIDELNWSGKWKQGDADGTFRDWTRKEVEQCVTLQDDYDRSTGRLLHADYKEAVEKQKRENKRPLYERQRDVNPAEQIPEENIPATGWADIFVSLYAKDVQWTDGGEPKLQEFLKAFVESPEYAALREETRLHIWAAEVSAVAVGKQFLKKNQQDDEEGEGDAEAEDDGMTKAVQAAAQAAEKAVQQARDAGRAFGTEPGDQPGIMSLLNNKKIVEIYKKVQGTSRVKNIVELAGRWRRFAQGVRASAQLPGEEISGVEQGGAVERLTPSELLALAGGEEALEWEAMRKIAEAEALVREMSPPSPEGFGPVIVCVDESGSMDGDRIYQAKAFALAIAWCCKQEGRWCMLTSFTESKDGGGVELPPNKWDSEKLIKWVDQFQSGGTQPWMPFQTVPRKYFPRGPKGKTDLVVITDGVMAYPTSLIQEFNAWKDREGAKAIALVIQDKPGEIGQLCDVVYEVKSVEQCEATGAILAGV